MNSRSKKFLSYYRPYLGLLFADLASALLLSATTLGLLLCTRHITKDLLEGFTPDTLSQIYALGGAMLALLAVHMAARVFVDYRGHMMGAMMERDMRRELFEHCQKLSFSFYDERRTGQLMTRITNDSFDMSELYHHGPEDIAISLLNSVGAFAILISIDAQLALVVFLFLPVMTAYAIYFNKRMVAALRRSKDRIGDINEQVEDTLAGIRVVQSFTNDKIEQEKFDHQNNRFLASRKDAYKNEACFYPGMEFGFPKLMSITVIIFASTRIVHGSLDLADLLTFLLGIEILLEPLDRFSNFVRLYQEGVAGFERFMEILEVEPDIKDKADAIDLAHVRGNIEFRNVGFKYKEDHDYVLKNISLKIPAGDYVALVGVSGIGKTTLCSLIPRFYEVNDGEILLDGTDIRHIRTHSLRKHIGIVHQDVYLFAGTVIDNIRYGKPDASQQEIVEAAKKANAHDFIMALPKGYETNIGQRGVKLSGGQKQRLSIARVFLKDPPIIIFDEATSALDNESERAVQDSLEKLTHNRTMLVIAHRLSTVRNAHRILVMTEHGIDEQGTHDELMARSGAYANLYNTQLRL